MLGDGFGRGHVMTLPGDPDFKNIPSNGFGEKKFLIEGTI
jgi:hypothetical protein